jgi:hypothetical protein
MVVESILAPFMQQADLCKLTYHSSRQTRADRAAERRESPLRSAHVAAVLGGFADVVGGCVCDADGDVLCGAALVIGQSQGSLARL